MKKYIYVIIMALIYLCINVVTIILATNEFKYLHVNGLYLIILIFTVVFPASLIVTNIISIKKNIRTLKIVMTALIGCYVIPVFIISFISELLCYYSETNSINHYMNVDKFVKESYSFKQYSEVFPDVLPDEVTDIKYHYYYENYWDMAYDISTQWTYINEEKYIEEVSRIKDNFTIRNIEIVDGYDYYYIDHTYDVYFACNDETLTVRYNTSLTTED